MNSKRWMAALGAICIGLAGCSDPVNVAELRPFLQDEGCPVASREYRVLPPDVLVISSASMPEVNGISQAVRPDGKVNLPLVGEIFVAGKTPKEIERQINEATREFYGRGEVTVHMAGYASQRVFVFGQVEQPGPHTFTGSDTLLDIMCKAQPTLYAWPEKVKLIRGGTPCRGGYVCPATSQPDGTMVQDGPTRPAKCLEMTVDLANMINKGDMRQNVMLRPDDVIIVPSHPLASAGLTLNQLLFPVRQAVEVIRLPETSYSQQTIITRPQ